MTDARTSLLVRASTAPGREGLYDLADGARAVRELLALVKQS